MTEEKLIAAVTDAKSLTLTHKSVYVSLDPDNTDYARTVEGIFMECGDQTYLRENNGRSQIITVYSEINGEMILNNKHYEQNSVKVGEEFTKYYKIRK